MNNKEQKPKMIKEEQLPESMRGQIEDFGLGIKCVESTVSTNEDWTRKDYYCRYEENRKPAWAGSETVCKDGRYILAKRTQGMYGGHKTDVTEEYASKGGRLLSRMTRAEGYDGTSTTYVDTYTYSKDGTEQSLRTEIYGTRTIGQGSGGKARLGSFSSTREYTKPGRLKSDGKYTPIDRSSYKETEKLDDDSTLITTYQDGEKVSQEERWENGNLKSSVDFVNGKQKNKKRYDKNGNLKQDFLTLVAKYGMNLTGQVIRCGCIATEHVAVKVAQAADNIQQLLGKGKAKTGR